MSAVPVILIEDDLKIAAQISEALRDRFGLLVFDRVSDFIKAAEARPKCLTIIDFDLKEADGILVYKRLKEKNPQARTIMISSSNNIPLAVSATKLGVIEFLRKPLIAADFTQIVEKLAREEEIERFSHEGIPNTEWLAGKSAKLIDFEKQIIRQSGSVKDLVLFAERGIDQKSVIQLIHHNSPSRNKKLVQMDLSSFSKETLEGHFWAALNELLSLPGMENVKKEEELPGIVFIEGFEVISSHFRLSIIDYLKNRTGKMNFNSDVKIILGICDAAHLQDFSGFEILTVPPLRERKEDLPAILAEYLAGRTNFSSVSNEVLDFICFYDFPGNYAELEDLIEATGGNGPTLGEINYGKNSFLSYLRSVVGLSPLVAAREIFERKLLGHLFKKGKRDIHSVARFLSVPKTVMDERIRDLDL